MKTRHQTRSLPNESLLSSAKGLAKLLSTGHVACAPDKGMKD